jgi:cell volume regulation protein A
MHDLEQAILVAAVLVILAIVGSKLSGRIGVPVVLLFLAIGMLAGDDGPGDIAFDDFELARGVGVIALVYILFAGGFDTRWSNIRPIATGGVLLATVGVVLTMVITGLASLWLFDLPWKEGMLVGAIVSSTDAAAVFSVLRQRGLRLRRRLGPLLELESGCNDPMAVFLTLGLLSLITEPGTGAPELLLRLVLQVAVGTLVGVLGGKAIVTLVNRLRLEYDGLYPVLMLGAVGVVFGAASLLGGSGFLAVYLAGLWIGNARLVHRTSLIQFHDALAWLMQIGMFLVLGLLVYPSELEDIAGRALALALVLVLVARPVATFVSLVRSHFDLRDRTFVAWAGLRGAVPIVLATFPEAEGLPDAQLFFNVVFFVVLVSVLVQGTTVGAAARLLGVEEREPVADLPARSPTATVTSALHEIILGPGSVAVGRRLVDLGLPAHALVVLIARDDGDVIPQGSTVLRPGDRLVVLTDDDTLPTVHALVAESRK